MRIDLKLIQFIFLLCFISACKISIESDPISNPTYDTDKIAPKIMLDYNFLESEKDSHAQDILLRVRLTEDINNLDEKILTLNYLEIISYQQTSPRDIEFVLRPIISEGYLTVQIRENTFKDAAGNGNEASQLLSIAVPQYTPKLTHNDRGFNFGWWNDTDISDAQAVKNLGGNLVRFVFRWYREEGKNHDSYNPNGLAEDGYIHESYLKILDEQLNWLNEAGIKIIFTVEAGGGSTRVENFWNNEEILNRYKIMWKFLIERYRDTPQIVAWELLSEPHPNKFYGSNFLHNKLKDFYSEVIHSLVDTANKNRPFIVGPQFFYKPDYLDDGLVITDETIKDRVLYTFNLLADLRGGENIYSYQYLYEQVELATKFREKHNVRIYCNQVGAELELVDSARIRADMIAILNAQDIPWTYWNWRGGVFEVKQRNGMLNQEVYDFFKELFTLN